MHLELTPHLADVTRDPADREGTFWAVEKDAECDVDQPPRSCAEDSA